MNGCLPTKGDVGIVHYHSYFEANQFTCTPNSIARNMHIYTDCKGVPPLTIGYGWGNCTKFTEPSIEGNAIHYPPYIMFTAGANTLSYTIVASTIAVLSFSIY